MTYKKILFFLPKKTINEATTYYVDIIKSTFEQKGYEIIVSDSFKDTKRYNNVFVMSAKWCFLVKLSNPKAKVITWFQGLGGEEALMTRGSQRDKMLWSIIELFAMRFSWLNIYVSKKMRDYYINKYNIKDNNYFIMPCFNKDLNISSFNFPNKYILPTFVYAGGLDQWQCVEKTLQLYSAIEKEVPNASLTLLTKEKEEALRLLKKYNINNSEIKFVSLDRLDEELEKFKYGFLIRENHIINNVSTPTKMNSYLANGIIPIYTDVIEDFNTNFKYQDFLLLNNNEDIDCWRNKIVNIENNNLVDINNYREKVIDLFAKYYSKDYYITSFSKNPIFSK